MRKLTFTLLMIAGSYGLSTAQVPNGGLERWRQFTGGNLNTYYDLDTNSDRNNSFLRTLNEINDVPVVPGPLTAFRCDTAHTGIYSARLRTSTFASILVPGFLGTGNVDLPNQTIYLGRQYTQRPDRFTAWYMYSPVSGDSAAFEVYFTQGGSVVGSGKQVIHGTVATWTGVDFDIDWTSGATPDSVVIICASSAGYDLVDVTMSVGQIGSTMWVDDISLEFGGVGVEEVDNGKVSIYPNPSADFININTIDLPSNLKLNIYDLSGKKVMSRLLNSNNEMIDISGLNSGTYLLVVQDAFNLIHRSKFIRQ